jgi:HPt (histidine-containing phosphotransfer) domain-containing protein
LAAALAGAAAGPDAAAAGPDAAAAGAGHLQAKLDELEQELGLEAAGELLAAFLRDTPGRLAELRQLADGPAGGGMARAAHALAGSCGIFGMESMRMLGLQLESLSEAGGESLGVIASLERELERGRPELERRLAALRQSGAEKADRA